MIAFRYGINPETNEPHLGFVPDDTNLQPIEFVLTQEQADLLEPFLLKIGYFEEKH